MPFVMEPSKPKKGPGSAIGCRTQKGRRRRSTPKTQVPSIATFAASIEDDHGFIGQELIRWDQDHQTYAGERREKRRVSSGSPRSLTHEDIGPIASPTVASRPCALALDTRFLSTHPEIGQEILQEYQNFVETLSLRGVAPDIVVSTATGRKHDLTVLIAKRKTPVEAAIPPMEDRGEEGICLPPTFSAATTWSIFFDFVEAIITYQKAEEPIDLTILSTDLAMFSDSKKDHHIASFEQFWNRLLPHYEGLRIARVRLVVAKKNAVTKTKNGSPQNEQRKEQPADTNHHEEAVEGCIQALREKLDELEFSTSTADFAFHSIQSSLLGYRALSRELVRESLSLLQCCVAFDLPESLDGTQCCVSFVARYQIFPYAFGSKLAEGLRDELRTLSRQKLEVVQSVALSSVDAGLLYGVPLSLSSAVEGTMDEFQEMEVLSRVLFRLLRDRELALVLRAKGTHGHEHFRDLYLLMAKEFPVAMQQEPQVGLLFKYANANQLLSEAEPAALCPYLEDEIEYVNYVESAIGRLNCEPFNPLDLVSDAKSSPMVTLKRAPSNQPFFPDPIHDEEDDNVDDDKESGRKKHSERGTTDTGDVCASDQGLYPHRQVMSDEDDPWNDSAGVGSRAQAEATQDLPEPMETNDSDDESSFFFT